MFVQIKLVDVNPKMIKAWRDTFEENPEVEIISGSMLDQNVSAWVSPTNSRGSMDGGLDAIIKSHLGTSIENRLQKVINEKYGGTLPVGFATCIPSGRSNPQFLISTPTMVGSSEDISDTMNVALACAAVFQTVHMQNSLVPGSIESIAIPGLGAATGRTPVAICADLMWSGYSLFRRRAFTDFAEMRAALEAELGELGPSSTEGYKVKFSPEFDEDMFEDDQSVIAGPTQQTADPKKAKEDEVDFDDF